MYGKIFESIYDGTLSADWKAMVTFQQLIVLANEDGIVDMTPPAISRRTGIPLEIIEHGVKKLEQPDKYSRSPDHEGRRIARLDDHRPWGWYIINYDKYRQMQKREEKKAADRERMRQKRADEKDREINNVAKCREVSQTVANVAYTDTNTDISFPTERPDADTVIWESGTALLGGSQSSRSFLGKLAKEYGKEKLAQAIASAAVHRPVSPKDYIVATLQERPATDPYYDQIRRASGADH